MEKTITPYLDMANEVIDTLQKNGTMSFKEYALVLALVANNVAESAAERGNDKQTAVDDICMAIRHFSE